MRIIVCAKHVADSTEIRFDEQTNQVLLEGAPTKISDYDRNALEAAVQLREQNEGVSVEVLMVGGSEAQKALKEAIAMGADKGYLIEGGWDRFYDPFLAARVLTRAIEDIGPVDLVLVGLYSEDGYNGLAGAALAELLDTPFLAPVTSLALAEDTLEAELSLPGVRVTASSPFPCVAGIDSTANVPRLPTVLQVMKVKSSRIQTLSLQDLGLTQTVQQKANGVRLDEYASGAVKRKAVVIEGDPESAAGRLVGELVQEGVLQ
ncbi:MAG: electron transfer flavoprotein subunit beta/FixA family protein [Thermoleophilia bacterium]